MTATLVPTSSEAEWLEARRAGITASEIAVVMGLSPWDSPYALYHRKLGILPQEDDSPMMERGRVLEPYLAEKFAAAHPELKVDGFGRELYRHDDRPWQMATPDRLLFGRREDTGVPRYLLGPVALAEFKTASSLDEWGEPGTDKIPVYYRAQVLWQMDVMDICKAYVTVLDVPRWQVSEYVIEHGSIPEDADGDDASECTVCCDILMMRDAAQAFLGHVEREEAPDVDWRPATIGALKQLHPSLTDEDTIVGDRLAACWRAAIKNEKHWEQRKRLYEARIREQMGSARRAFTAVGSELVCRRDVYTVREHTRRESTVDKLVIVNPKKES